MKNLYSNIGDKVCKVAKVCGGIGVIATLVGVIMLIGAFASAEDLIIASLIIIVLGVISVVSSWPLYAFGQITKDIRTIKSKMSKNISSANYSDLPEI